VNTESKAQYSNNNKLNTWPLHAKSADLRDVVIVELVVAQCHVDIQGQVVAAFNNTYYTQHYAHTLH